MARVWGMASQLVLFFTRQRRLMGSQLTMNTQYHSMARSIGRTGLPLAATAKNAPRKVVRKEMFTPKNSW